MARIAHVGVAYLYPVFREHGFDSPMQDTTYTVTETVRKGKHRFAVAYYPPKPRNEWSGEAIKVADYADEYTAWAAAAKHYGNGLRTLCDMQAWPTGVVVAPDNAILRPSDEVAA